MIATRRGREAQETARAAIEAVMADLEARGLHRVLAANVVAAEAVRALRDLGEPYCGDAFVRRFSADLTRALERRPAEVDGA